MVLRSMPASRNLKLSVPSTSKSGKPAAKPSASMRRLAGCKYKRSASRQGSPAAASASSTAAAAVAGHPGRGSLKAASCRQAVAPAADPGTLGQRDCADARGPDGEGLQD